MEFFSYPVIAGFTFSAALTIAASQFKAMLGIPGKANGFLETLVSVLENISQSQSGDVILGFSTFVALLLMRVLATAAIYKTTPINFAFFCSNAGNMGV